MMSWPVGPFRGLIHCSLFSFLWNHAPSFESQKRLVECKRAWQGNKLGGCMFDNIVHAVYLGVRNKSGFLFSDFTWARDGIYWTTISFIKRHPQYFPDSMNCCNNKPDTPYYTIEGPYHRTIGQ